jgi:uncharacterized membrane protein
MLANLRALFGSVVDIILFRRGPENLPASQALLAVLVAVNIVGSVLMSAVSSLPTSNALLESILGTVLMLLWFRAALAIANKRERFLQTLSAIFGVNILFLPVLVPLLGALLPYLEKGDANTPPPAALFLITLFVGLWAFVVEIRIVRAAFECPWIGAILLVVGELFAATFVATLLLGVPARAAA